jgi:hypothetical protein
MSLREIYLFNDHRVHYRVEERTTGKFLSGLTLNAYLSDNPTGSAVTSSVRISGSQTLESGDFEVTQSVTVSSSADITQSVTMSLLIVSQSLTSSFSSSATGSVTLATTLTEDPGCSGDYIGIIPGYDIASALSASITESHSSSFDAPVTSSFTQSIVIGSVSHSLFVTSSHIVTSSFTTSVDVPVVETSPRAPGIYEIITSGSEASGGLRLRVTTPFCLRSARFI